MAVAAKTNEQVMVEQLQGLVAELTQEKKAKESAIKELDTQIKLAEAESVLKIKAAQEAFDKQKADLTAAIQPLEHLKGEMARLTAEIAKLKQDKLDATAEIKAARGLEIEVANNAVAKAQDKLNRIHLAIDACKEKVAAL